jgi:hypothetical protein
MNENAEDYDESDKISQRPAFLRWVLSNTLSIERTEKLVVQTPSFSFWRHFRKLGKIKVFWYAVSELDSNFLAYLDNNANALTTIP